MSRLAAAVTHLPESKKMCLSQALSLQASSLINAQAARTCLSNLNSSVNHIAAAGEQPCQPAAAQAAAGGDRVWAQCTGGAAR